MKRISTDELFIKIANEVAKRSTCARVQVGAVIVKDQRIISMGWNGVAHGQEHCVDHFENEFKKLHSDWDLSNMKQSDFEERFKKWINTDAKDLHHQFAIRHEIHSEMNAMIYAAKNGISTNGADLYVVWSPCIDCAKALSQAGIKTVYYSNKYERDTSGIDFLEENGIKCIQVKYDEDR